MRKQSCLVMRALGPLLVATLLALSAGQGAAQGPGPAGGAPAAETVGTTFTYQGELNKDGAPVNDTCEMVFSLYDDAAAGGLVGGPLTLTVAIADGLFTAALDFGGYAFVGEARWLGIAVQCPGDGDFNTLIPRQALTAAPYALGLRPGAVIRGPGGGTGDVLSAINTDIGGAGVRGWAIASSGNTRGVVGQSDSTDGRGVHGVVTAGSGQNYGVYGESASPNGTGVHGYAGSGSGETYGVYGQARSTAGRGVYGVATASSGRTYGVYAESASTEGRGLYSSATSTSGYTFGIYALAASSSGIGVYGRAYSTEDSETNGVYGRSDSPQGIGVRGYASATSGPTRGLWGRVLSTEGCGVYGWASADGGVNYGVYGRSNSSAGYGMLGYASADSGVNYGVYGQSNSAEGYGVYGTSPRYGVYGYGSTHGVVGLASAPQGRGVQGYASATSGGATGVEGVSLSPDGYAGYFVGNVEILGYLSKASGSFKIDHPLAPADKYLYHSFVESPDMKNIYDGVVVLDEKGEAWVELPAWFEALNGGPEHRSEFRYQLTCIGGYAPVYVAREIENSRFQIAGGAPGVKVSWQVTAIRHDPWAEAHRIPVEQDKPEDERGTYLYPELYGQPEELGLSYQRSQGLRELALPTVPE